MEVPERVSRREGKTALVFFFFIDECLGNTLAREQTPGTTRPLAGVPLPVNAVAEQTPPPPGAREATAPRGKDMDLASRALGCVSAPTQPVPAHGHLWAAEQ